MIYRTFYLSLLFAFLLTLKGSAQDNIHQTEDGLFVFLLENGDSIPMLNIAEIEIQSRYTLKHRRQVKRYNRLAKKVKKVYPYALIAENCIKELEVELADIDSEKEQRRLIKAAEKELFSEFEDEVRKMKMSEGRILVKLIDRQTGDTSYELIKELRGSFSAFFWQGIAKLFGNDLKANFNAEEVEEDQMIEDIVMKIETGEIKL